MQAIKAISTITGSPGVIAVKCPGCGLEIVLLAVRVDVAILKEGNIPQPEAAS